VNGKQARRAREVAYNEAMRRGLWKKGEASLSWWRKLFAKVFPRLRRKYAGWVGRWYKRTLKKWSKLAYEYVHSGQAERDYIERRRFAKVQQAARQKRTREAMERAQKRREEASA
jgi:hypothetical protein